MTERRIRLGRSQRVLLVVAALALLFGGAWLALQQVFPPQRIADIVAAQVSSRTGRDFRIQGQLDWRLTPKLAVVAEDLTLANAPWGSRPDMLRVRRAAMQLELWPLLQGRVEIDSVTLDGVDVLLETDDKGTGNWQMPQLEKSESRPGSGGGGGGGEAAQTVDIDKLRLGDVFIAYHDGVSGRKQAITLQQLALDRNAQGLKLESEWVLQKQRWTASGQLGPVAQWLDNQADWPLQLALRSEGARIDVKGRQLHGAARRTGRLDIDASVDKAAALAPWLDSAARVPLPVLLKTSLTLTTESVRAEALTLSLAGQILKGSATVRSGKPWQAQASLDAESLDLSRMWPSGPAGGGGSSTARRQLFDDQPLPIDTLPQGMATLQLRIARLLLPDLPPLSAVQADAQLRPGSLKIEPLAFGVAGGQVRGGVTLNTSDAAPRLNLRIDGNGLSAETLARAAGAGNYLAGGQLQLKTDLAMTGRSTAELAAGANGELLLSIKDARLGDGVAPIGPNLLPQLLRALTLKPEMAKVTQVDCAVMRLPLRNGVAKVDRSIAVETPDLAISAVGSVDLRDQLMELAFHPTPKHALGLNTAQLASLVMAKGPLLDPKLTLDAKGAADMALSIGAAVATGGLSMLGQSLLKQTGDLHPCQYALTGVAAPRKAANGAAAAQPQAPPSPQQVLPGLLRKLFNK